jgi:hypothetical protein
MAHPDFLARPFILLPIKPAISTRLILIKPVVIYVLHNLPFSL